MKSRTKWLVFSVAAGILATGAFSFVVALSRPVPSLLDPVMRMVFWPVILSVHLSGQGPSIGPPERHFHEGTPIQLIAVAIGLFLTVIFWSGLVFVVVRVRRRRVAD
jgi:hypothetical protein